MKPNWENRTIWTADNLDIMRGMNDESIDLIYLDPPFNSKRFYEAPIGSEAAGAAFKDTWRLSDLDEAWHGEIADKEPVLYAIIDAAGLSHSKSMKSYLIMMCVRLLEMKRLLKPVGSIYLHCDPTASHYLKALMDGIFGKGNYRNEILWCYKSGGSSKRYFSKKHDIILLYSKTSKYFFNPLKQKSYMKPKAGKNPAQTYYEDEKGTYTLVNQKDWWNDIGMLATSSKERIGYPTQKPLALLDRIIRASCPEGGIVLDPFCGCATALVMAEHLKMEWVGIDLSELASKLIVQRLDHEASVTRLMPVYPRTDFPKRDDQGKLPNYRTHKHTLFGKQEGHCNGCLVHFPFRNFTIDHIVPQVRGGTDHLDNLQLLCGACNSTKGPRSQEALIVELKKRGLR